MQSIQASAATQPRVARQTVVSVTCEKKSFTRKVVETTGTMLVATGLIASQSLAFNVTSHKLLLLEPTKGGLYFEPATGEKQEKYQAKLKEREDLVRGTLLRDPEVQALIKKSTDNQAEFERYRLLNGYAAFERVQQATPEGTCKFPMNFLGCDGKFAQSKWIKEKRSLDCKYAEPGQCVDSPIIGQLTPGTKKTT